MLYLREEQTATILRKADERSVPEVAKKLLRASSVLLPVRP